MNINWKNEDGSGKEPFRTIVHIILIPLLIWIYISEQYMVRKQKKDEQNSRRKPKST